MHCASNSHSMKIKRQFSSKTPLVVVDCVATPISIHIFSKLQNTTLTVLSATNLSEKSVEVEKYSEPISISY